MRESEEHELLRSSVRRFVATELPPERVRELDEQRAWPRSLWQRLADLGWTGLMVDEAHGGAGAELSHAAVVTEELARGFASLAVDFVLASMMAAVIEAWGTGEQATTLLPRIASGASIVALGMTEPSGGTDVLALRTHAHQTPAGWSVRGQKLYTSMGDEADQILVLARTDPAPEAHRARGLSLILVPTDQAAVSVRRLRLMGMRAAATCEVFLDDARAPRGALVGERGRGFHHLLAALDHERILGAAISLGIAEAALAEARAHARVREAYGRPIGAFQAVAHPIVDTAIDVAASRALLERALARHAAGEGCAEEASMAKVAAAEAAVRATDRGMRVLAAHGMSEESSMGRCLRDARLGVFSPISNEMARNFLAERMGLARSY